MFGVETFSFLPQGQSDRRDLARQGETGHRGPHPFGEQRGVEIMERSGASAGRGGRAFEDIFQLVVVIFIQTPGREKFPRAKAARAAKQSADMDASLHRPYIGVTRFWRKNDLNMDSWWVGWEIKNFWHTPITRCGRRRDCVG